MKERPILFNAEMVKAVLDGRKTQTRRIVKPQLKLLDNGFVTPKPYHVPRSIEEHTSYCTLGQIGDRLYIRETFAIESNAGFQDVYGKPENPLGPIKYEKGVEGDDYFLCPRYKASEPNTELWTEDDDEFDYKMKWKPSIHMPKWASRIMLEITNIRLERVQDITTEDVRSEGIKQRFPNVNDKFTPSILRGAFIELWHSTATHPEYEWKANPWVWVVEFKVM